MEKQTLFERLSTEEAKEKYEQQYGYEVIEILEIRQAGETPQKFLILEWNHRLGEFCIRNIYVHLRPIKTKYGGVGWQKLGQGSGLYPQFDDREQEGIAIDDFWKHVEFLKEDKEVVFL